MGKYLVFGATGGIGSAIARKLAASGHELVLSARDEAKLTALANELGGQAKAGDVTSEAEVQTVVEAAGSDIDGLVYAVGTINLKPLARLSEDDFLSDFRINALGAANAVKAALPALKAGEGGAVLLFSTVAVSQGFASHASVSMAKGAVEGLTRALAAELAPSVRVNAIAPSLTDTPLAKAMTSSDQMAKAIAGMHPIPRLGVPEDMAGLAELLLDKRSGWITGQVFGVDGGRSTLRTKG